MALLKDMHITFKLCFLFNPSWCCEIQRQKGYSGLLPTAEQLKKLSEAGTYKIPIEINATPF